MNPPARPAVRFVPRPVFPSVPPMHLADAYADDRFGLSFEIFPPKTDAGDDALRAELARLVEYDPAFISCTYGAGGSTSERSLGWCRELHDEFGQAVTAHFTCVGAGAGDLAAWLRDAADAGVANIMALRGDAPEDGEWTPAPGGLRYANELVSFLRERFPEFGVGVAGYPEKHPECPDPDTDLANLKRKVDAGADAVFTQLFFDNTHFLRWRDACGEAGIDVPIIPGVMPVTDFGRIKRITAMCGSSFPADFAEALEDVKDDKLGQFEVGVDWAVKQCRDLMEEGVPGVHFYVLNKAAATEQILDGMNLAAVAV